MNDTLANRLSLPRIHWGWLLVFAAALALVVGSRAVLGPFLAGFIIAYLLDPLALRLEARGVPRWAAASLTLLLFIAAAVGLIVAVAPIVQAQIGQLVDALPRLTREVQPMLARLVRRAGGASQQKALVGDVTARAVGWLTASAGAVIAGTFAFFNVLTLVVIAPIVAFYLLRDWQPLTARLDSWWPRRHLPTIRLLLGQSDAALSGFIRGQFLVCCALAVLYAVGWSLVGLDYAIVLALLAGVLGFVPFVGPLFCVGMSLLVGLGQFGPDPLQLGLVFGVFVVVQTIEGAVLTPNLIGDRIGLHPVWVLFSVFAGAELAGLVGVFLAVPVAAVIGVFTRWMLARYLKSRFYADGAPPEPAVPPLE